MKRGVLVFDCDGVLVDVTESYREAIQQTVASFTGVRPTRELIQQYKLAGGWNNDWKLSHRLIQEAGLAVTYEEVVARFDRLFMGANGSGDGLIVRERWIAEPGLFERLAENYRLAIFTGRHAYELEATLRRLGFEARFDPCVTHDADFPPKPAPQGLQHISGLCRGEQLIYVGDTIDDARCARAAGARFVGITAGSEELEALFRRESADAILNDINQLESVLPL